MVFPHIYIFTERVIKWSNGNYAIHIHGRILQEIKWDTGLNGHMSILYSNCIVYNLILNCIISKCVFILSIASVFTLRILVGGFYCLFIPPPPRPNIFKHTPTQPTPPLSPRFVIILCVSFIIYYPHALQLNQKTRK